MENNETIIENGSVIYINGFKWVKSEPYFQGITMEGLDDNGKKITLQITKGLELIALSNGRVAIIDEKYLTFIHGTYRSIKKNKYKPQRYTICGLREGNIVKIGYSICSTDDRFVKSIGRNEAAKNAINSVWTIPVLDDKPKTIRYLLYHMANLIEDNFTLFKMKLSKPKKVEDETPQQLTGTILANSYSGMTGIGTFTTQEVPF
jgi:hypothetical protein